MKLDEKTVKERIMEYILSVKSPVVTLPWLQEVILRNETDEIDLDAFEAALDELLGDELEWVDEEMLTLRLRPKSWKRTRKEWK